MNFSILEILGIITLISCGFGFFWVFIVEPVSELIENVRIIRKYNKLNQQTTQLYELKSHIQFLLDELNRRYYLSLHYENIIKNPEYMQKEILEYNDKLNEYNKELSAIIDWYTEGDLPKDASSLNEIRKQLNEKKKTDL